jgi:hypothetical protein
MTTPKRIHGSNDVSHAGHHRRDPPQGQSDRTHDANIWNQPGPDRNEEDTRQKSPQQEQTGNSTAQQQLAHTRQKQSDDTITKLTPVLDGLDTPISQPFLPGINKRPLDLNEETLCTQINMGKFPPTPSTGQLLTDSTGVCRSQNTCEAPPYE